VMTLVELLTQISAGAPRSWNFLSRVTAWAAPWRPSWVCSSPTRWAIGGRGRARSA
jgi:hypothetical protein